MEIENFLESKREVFIRESLMSDAFLDFVERNTDPFDRLMAYYKCAIMEVETKFKVLNEEFSLQYDHNPIESIKYRTKSIDSLIRKVRDKQIPLTLESIEENIKDIAGVRVICSFTDDMSVEAG